jgi:hypothetical protein
MIYLLTAIGLSPGGSSTVQYTFTHKQYTERYKTNSTYKNTTILEARGPCPVLASYTLLSFSPKIYASNFKIFRIYFYESMWAACIWGMLV